MSIEGSPLVTVVEDEDLDAVLDDLAPLPGPAAGPAGPAAAEESAGARARRLFDAEPPPAGSPALARTMTSPALGQQVARHPPQPARRTSMPPVSRETEAAVELGRLWRGHRARRRAESDVMFRIFQTLDAYEERGVLERSQSQRELVAGAGAAGAAGAEDIAPPEPPALLVSHEVVSTYDAGCTPVTVALAAELTERVRGGGRVTAEEAANILTQARDTFRLSPTVVDVDLQGEQELTVCGDLHGQLSDLLHILDARGPPSATNFFLFNGDFVDRGRCGAEIVLLLCAWKLAQPGSVFLTRGNHESLSPNVHYGFEAECVAKYDRPMFERFQRLFDWLPIATVVNERVLVLHGGLMSSRTATLDDLRRLDRHRQVPEGHVVAKDAKLMQEVLWSDPRDVRGRNESQRGAGIFFGPDVTQDFLERSGLELIVRSHECVAAGVELTHDGRVLTVFSVTNYCGAANKGGYAVFGAGAAQPRELVSYTAAMLPVDLAHAPGGGGGGDGDEAEQQIETVVLLIEQYVRQRHDHLLALFARADARKSGKVNRLTWSKVMKAGLQLDVPWLRLHQYFAGAKLDAAKRVDYRAFLASLRADDGANEEHEEWQRRMTQRIADVIARSAWTVPQAFQHCARGQPALTCADFQRVVREMFPKSEFNDQQLAMLFHAIDVNGSGSIDEGEFVGVFSGGLV